MAQNKLTKDYSLSTFNMQFWYTEQFTSSVRRGLGILIPALVIILLLKLPYEGITATLGAFCVSIVDQPGPLRHRINQMSATALLSGSITWVTVICSGSPLLLWLIVSFQAFLFAFLSVYGKHGAYLGAACLTILMMALHGHITQQLAGYHALVTFAGGMFYTLLSASMSRLNWYIQEKRALADCYSRLADYVDAKSAFYLPQCSLTECYRNLHLKNNGLTESEDAMRNIVLRSPPVKGTDTNRSKRQKLINLFIQMVDLHEHLWLGQADYQLIRTHFEFDPVFPAIHDLLKALAQDIRTVERQLISYHRHHQDLRYPKALKVLHTHILDLQKRHQKKLTERNDGYISLIRLYRKLRNSCNALAAIQNATESPAEQLSPYLTTRSELQSFITRQNFSLHLLWDNLKLSSSHFRHAFRVLVACSSVLFFGLFIFPHYFQHSFWILLTVFVILKPAFSLTKERNIARLSGTIVGCLLGFFIISVVENTYLMFFFLFLSLALSSSFTATNYTLSSLFITVTGVIFIHYTSPEALHLIGDRGLDTFFGCIIAYACAHILPKWEESEILQKTKNCIQKNHQYLASIVQNYHPIQARLHRKNVNISHSNLSGSYYRMLQEPESHHQQIHTYHSLLIELDALSTNINDLKNLWPKISPLSHNSQQVLQAALDLLSLQQADYFASPELKKALQKLPEDYPTTLETAINSPNGLEESHAIPSLVIRTIYQYAQRISERYFVLYQLAKRQSN